MRTVVQRQQSLMTEGSRGGMVKQAGYVPFAAGFLEPDTGLVRHAGGHFESLVLVDMGGKSREKLVVHQPLVLAGRSDGATIRRGRGLGWLDAGTGSSLAIRWRDVDAVGLIRLWRMLRDRSGGPGRGRPECR